MNDRLYQAWHQRIGHAEYRLHITMEGYGSDEDAAVAFLDAFEKTHPEAGAAISQDRTANTITATFSLRATNDQHAFDLGLVFWAEAGMASGLEPGEVVRSEIELVPAEADCPDGEREPITA